MFRVSVYSIPHSDKHNYFDSEGQKEELPQEERTALSLQQATALFYRTFHAQWVQNEATEKAKNNKTRFRSPHKRHFPVVKYAFPGIFRCFTPSFFPPSAERTSFRFRFCGSCTPLAQGVGRSLCNTLKQTEPLASSILTFISVPSVAQITQTHR